MQVKSSNIKKTPVMVLFFCLCLCLTACSREEGQSTVSISGENERITLKKHESKHDFGEYVVHVNALTTDLLSAEIAASYNLERGSNRAMLNVFIAQRSGEVNIPVAALVQVSARNLNNQLKDMPINEIREEGAIYYIGEVRVSDGEVMVFDIDIQPEGTEEKLLLSYQKEFFTQ